MSGKIVLGKMALEKILRAALLIAFVALFSGVPSSAFASPRPSPMPRPLPSPDQGKNLVRLAPPSKPAMPGPCDRNCLNGFVDKYFDALVSHCTCGVALAPDVKYTENGEIVKPGEGIWNTFTGRGKYRLYLADPSTGQAGYYGDYSEFTGKLLGALALRLKVKDHQITEVEVILDRQQLRPSGGLGLNTAGIMTPKMIDELDPAGFSSPDSALLMPVPQAQRSRRNQMIAISDRYFEGYSKDKGDLVPFADRCSVRENGIAAANNSGGPVLDPAQPAFRVFSQSCAQELDRGFFSAVAKFRDRRALVVDEQQGLVLNLAMFDNEGNVKSVDIAGVGTIAVPREFLRPITFAKPQLFKIEDGKIREIEGLAWALPYGMASGWPN
jgi:hypothetical protein